MCSLQHVTGMYDAETQTCYLLRGVPSSDSAPSELEATLDSETGVVSRDPHLLCTAQISQTKCNGLNIQLLQPNTS